MKQKITSVFQSAISGLFALGAMFLTIAPLSTKAQVQLTSPSAFRLQATTPGNKVVFKFTVTQPVGKTISQVYASINGVNYPTTTPTGNVYPVNWTTQAFGTYTLKGFVQYSNGSKDSTLAFAYKVIQTSACGAMRYSANTGYSAGDTVVTATDSVYRRTSWWMQGDYPTSTNANWSYIGMCNSNMYVAYNCNTISAWSSTATYGTPNTLVNYNGLVFSNNWWAQGDVPGVSGAWKQKGGCAIPNQVPVINTPFNKDTIVVMNPVTAFTIPATITDADGNVISTSFAINNTTLQSNKSGNNYTATYLPAGYGDYTLKITGTDEENGTGMLTSVIHIMPSLPPVVAPSYPVASQIIGNISNIGNVAVSLVATVTDPDNAIATVTFSINNGTPFNASAVGNNYTASWTPPAYGTYTLTIKATDAASAFTSKTISFNVDNPNTQSVTFANLPLQLKMNIGNTKTFSFNAPIQSVDIRNKSLAKVVINGNQLLVTGYRTGRTGLKIKTATGEYFVGLRVNNNDGTAPALPPYASIGFVSEDSPWDLKFWEEMKPGLANKNADVRYIYIGDGPIGNCAECNTWRDTMRHINYCKNSLKLGVTPFFVYYNLASSSESFDADLRHARDTNYMKAYFKDLSSFVKQCHDVMGDDMFGIVLEPDFLGYMQQLGGLMLGTNDPNLITTCVTANGIAQNSGNIKTLVTRINKTIADRRDMGANIFYGWQMNLWSDPTTTGTKGIMRTTDAPNPNLPGDFGWTAGRQNVVKGATNVANYITNSGVTSHGADFISMDKYGLDAGAFSASNSWWFNNDHWDNYMLYAKTVHQVSGKPVVLWQLPVGHINTSTMVSAYTNTQFPPLNNSSEHFEDPCATYFFGDKFIVTDPAKKAYLSQNNAGDTSLHVLTNDTLQWGGHINKFLDAGIVHAMFGAGVGISTNGIHDNNNIYGGPTDQYWSIQKIQNYYENNISWVDTTIFTNTILSYNCTDTATKALRNTLGAATYMYYGYNNMPVSETGEFKPSNLKKGMNYISFVSNTGQNANWKVQRVMIGNGSANKGGTTGIESLGDMAGSFAIYASPNPASNECMITVDGIVKDGGLLQLVSIDGKVLRNYTMHGNRQMVDLSDLQKGLYLVKYNNGINSNTLKIVKD